jgi:hypothetical protein
MTDNHMKRHLVFISDLGHTGVIWPRILDGLESMGWKVTVLCPKLSFSQWYFFGLNYYGRKWKYSPTDNFYSPYRKFAGYPKLVRHLITFFSKFEKINPQASKLNLDGYENWIGLGFKQLERMHSIDGIDLILSSSSPFASHVIASKFSNKFDVPWIADYRDLWSLNHTFDLIDPERVVYEKNIISIAKACITTSLGFSEDLEQIYRGRIFTIHNGFTNLNKQKKSSKIYKKIQIVYPGQIYDGLQDIKPLLIALDNLNSGGNLDCDLELFVSGYAISSVKKYLSFMELKNEKWLKYGRVLTLRKNLKLQRNADLLVLLNCVDNSITGVLQTKLYEYLASGTPILAIGGEGKDESSQILIKSGNAFLAKNEEEIEKFLIDFSQNKVQFFNRNDTFIAEFDRFNQGKVLSAHIDEILKAP